MSEALLIPCPCGESHPKGYHCEKAAVGEDRTRVCGSGHECGHVHEPAEHDGCCHHDHEHHSHEHPDAECGCLPEWLSPDRVEAVELAPGATGVALYRIMNMDCPMEEALIRKKLGSLEGVVRLDFNLMQRLLVVHHTLASGAPLVEALTAIDMTPEELEPAEKSARCALPDAPAVPWKRIVAAGALAAVSECLELVHEWGFALFGADAGAVREGELWWLSAGALLFALGAIALSGLTTYRKGWLALVNRNLNINALMAVAVTGAVLIGQFPEAAMVMVLFSLSEALEARALDRARDAIRDLLSLTPETATVVAEDGTRSERAIGDIPAGARIHVHPGERIALDGVVVEGTSAVNQAPITGESIPVEKGAGSQVFAGTINQNGALEVRVTAVAGDTTLARIIRAVEEAQGNRAPMQRFVDVFARWYTPLVFAAAILTALVPPLFMGASWSGSIYTGLVLLVIGCPCALVISTPVSIVSGMAAATKSGILVKGGAFLERGRLLRCMAFDKTGTITRGEPRQTDFLLPGAGEGGLDAPLLRSVGASLAAASDHPVSLAIAEAARQDGVELVGVREFAALPGEGVHGEVAGSLWHLGSRRLAERLGGSREALEAMEQLEQKGRTVVALVGATGVAAVFGVADTVRPTSREAIEELDRMGIDTVLLTGDNPVTAGAIAAEVGIREVRAGLLPQEKLEAIEALEKGGRQVGMAGDGINDAPALARADIGFAMAGAGTDTAMETADVAIMDDDLRKIPRFIRLSRATHAILVENIALALGIKALFFLLAFTGNATMWMAVFADVGAALLVVGNGLRAARK